MVTEPLRIVFAGTPDIASTVLQELLTADESIVAVYTQADKPAGRGRKITMSAVKKLALEHDIQVFQPTSLKEENAQQQLRDLKPDLMIVIAYGLILPQEILDIPKWGCINIHTSLLPRWRGAAPIQRAILAGDKKTGVTIMQMEAGLDTGPMIYKVPVDIASDETSQSLHDKLARLGSDGIVTCLQMLRENKWQFQAQDDATACYAAKIHKSEALIDWTLSAVEIERRIRGFYPWPIAYTLFSGERLRLYQGAVLAENASAQPGTIVQVDRENIAVATGEGLLLIQTMQLPGGRPLAVKDILNAHQEKFKIGVCFGS